MLEFHEKRKLQRVLYSKPVLLFMCVPVVFMAYAVWNAYETERDQQERQTKLAADLSQLESRVRELDRSTTQLDDPRGVEAGLRQRYEVGREGEQAIVFVEEDEPQVPEAPPEEAQTSFWGRIFDIVF